MYENKNCLGIVLEVSLNLNEIHEDRVSSKKCRDQKKFVMADFKLIVLCSFHYGK